MEKLKVEIWSDVMCPFCYIGKRRFETALAQFAHKDMVEVEWKSFQLNPDMPTNPDKSINQYLAEAKGWSLERAREMNGYVTNMAKEAGLTYNMDKAVVANSFDAHRLSHLAKKHGRQDEVEEKIFAAYFTEGRNTADAGVLKDIAASAGIDTQETITMLEGDEYGADVQRDVYEAQQIGVRGVPFFVLGRKYAISGAQESDAFLQALTQTWTEMNQDKDQLDMTEGATCTPDGCN